MSLRYTGILCRATPAYGFINEVRDNMGNLVESFEGGVFVHAGEAAKTFGKGRHLLLRLNGATVAFSLRKSGRHPKKLEAQDLREVEGSCL